MPAPGKRRRQKRVRERDWSEKHDTSFTHDLKRHRQPTGIKPQPKHPGLRYTENIAPNGTVIAHTRQWAFVDIDGKEVLCDIDENIREDHASVLATGDRVLVDLLGQDPVVRAVAPRTSKISRMALEQSRLLEQVIAVNIDQLLIVAAAAQPALKAGLIDRYLVMAQVGGVDPLLCVNKLDLVESEPPELQAYRELGLPVYLTSCENRTGIDTLRDALCDKTTVLAGHSGVGKSSLLNLLDPDLDITTRTVSKANDKGKHTTTESRLYSLAGNIKLIDTPGIRQLGVWGVSEEEISYYFPEFDEYALQCKFSNCTHLHEPDCAVLQALEDGAIVPLRYRSYTKLRADLAERANKR